MFSLPGGWHPTPTSRWIALFLYVLILIVFRSVPALAMEPQSTWAIVLWSLITYGVEFSVVL